MLYRGKGLVWIMLKLHSSCERFDASMLPNFLDNEPKNFLIQLANLEIDLQEKMSRYSELIKDNKIYKSELFKPLATETNMTILDMLRYTSTSTSRYTNLFD